MTCSADDITCVLSRIADNVEELVGASPWPGFALTALATFLGALAAFAFSLLLWRFQRRAARSDRMDDQIARAVDGLNRFAVALASNGADEGRYRPEILGHLRVARLYSTEQDYEVLDAAWTHISDRGLWPEHRGSQNAERVANLLVSWRSGRATDREVVGALGTTYQSGPPPDMELGRR